MTPLLSTDEVRCLDVLTITSSGGSRSPAAGLRQSRMRGHGLEFQDYRPYQPGDDPRFIDWTLDARLRQLSVRVFRAEGQLRIHLLLDVSRSMSAGSPSKLAVAKKIAAAAAYLAVEHRDAVGLATFTDRIDSVAPVAAGQGQLFRLAERLGMSEPDGASGIASALTQYASATAGPGLAILVSDFLDGSDVIDAMRRLRFRGLALALVQILAPEDIAPAIAGEVELTDIEDPSRPPLVVDRRALALYHERLGALTNRLRDFCAEFALPWVQVCSSTPFAGIVHACIEAGLLGART
jgi:uncharacterized protein (DUF58 family)